MDFDANFEVAQIFEQSDPKVAIKYYEAGIRIIKQHIDKEQPEKFKFMKQWPSSFEDPKQGLKLTQTFVPPEILSNYAVLLLQEDPVDMSEVIKYLEEALKNCDMMVGEEGTTDDTRLKALKMSIRFNLACCFEKNDKIGEASDIFKAIIAEEPTYADAYMRLAYLAKGRGDMKKAIEYLDQSKAVFKEKNCGNPTKIYCMKGRLLLEMGQLGQAFAEFSKALDLTGRRDSYARAGLATIHY
jgi:tetratricopeptide (TPR) repeat protein